MALRVNGASVDGRRSSYRCLTERKTPYRSMDIASIVIEPLVGPVKKQLGYLCFCTTHVREMGTKMMELDRLRSDVENRIDSTSSTLQVPAHVLSWSEKVGTIKKEVENIPGDVNNCFNLKMRHKIGRKAFKAAENIDRLIKENPGIEWTCQIVPLGKVDSKKASMSIPSAHYNDFKSRESTFEKALKALQSDDDTHMIALCGMGGVGKTTMMKKLKNVVAEDKMFDYIVITVVGEKTNPISLQQAVADYLSIDLTEKTKEARADRLRKCFEDYSHGGTNKILVILDDVWELVDLNDIGLSPLPSQGVGFKFLLTSRDQNVCRMMGVKANSVFNVEVIKEVEAQNFFRQVAEISDDVDPEILEIGEDIVRRCGGLPIAIKTIALALKHQVTDVWKDAVSRLEHNDHNIVDEVFGISYNHLQEETKEILLLCGLFPEDFDIPMEDLMKYGWALGFLKVNNLIGARHRLKTYVDQLIRANLLIESDRVECVKKHDLLHAYLLRIFSKVKHASIVNHGNMLEPLTGVMNESCERISLTCMGMSEFFGEFKYPNLSTLKLMHGDKSLRFPENFYEGLKKLQLIAYDKMQYPLIPGSLQCSTNLQTLCLHSCLLMDELSQIGNLMNLEILSFAYCSIRKLPSTIGNLKKLRLLDLTGCMDLQIDDGILEKLECLEELYMRVANKRVIRFTDNNYKELKRLSRKLLALEVEFFKNKVELENEFFKCLERFRISIGRCLEVNEGNGICSFENTLMIVMAKAELLESRMNELFWKTKVLHLKVDGMNDLESISIESSHPPRHSLFHNLGVLNISESADLRYVFTLPVARGLSKLEHLTISSCPILEELVHVKDSRAELIKFQKLKFLCLEKLPKLVSLCKNAGVIELPELVELRLKGLPNFTNIYPKNNSSTYSTSSSNISTMRSFLNEEIVIPKLEKLEIGNMENLKEIFSGREEVNIGRFLREIRVKECESLVNLFPNNLMSWLQYLEELYVENCGCIEVIFDMDFGCAFEIEENNRSNLRKIHIKELGKLRHVWMIKGINDSRAIIHGFQAVKDVHIEKCKSFRSLFTPTTANFDLGEVDYVFLDGEEISKESEEENESMLSNTNTGGQQFNFGETLGGVDVVFDIDSASSNGLPVFPQLKYLNVWNMERMSHVWKCNWNNFLFCQQLQVECSFQNLTHIRLFHCKSIKYLFSPLMAKFLPNLMNLRIWDCDDIEEVVSNRDDEKEETSTSTHTNTGFFPHLDTLELSFLQSLKRIGGVHDQLQHARLGVAPWSLCQYSRKLRIINCHTLSNVIPSHVARQPQKLEKLKICDCDLMMELFESEGSCSSTNMTWLQLPNLEIVTIDCCGLLGHTFSFSILESLTKLKELTIQRCNVMQVIVQKEHTTTTTPHKVVIFPRLQSLTLVDLPALEGFFLGINDFEWPLLDYVKIDGCPQMMVFTSGHSTTPKLNYIHTELGKHRLECGLNFHRSHSQERRVCRGIPWSFSNLIQVDMEWNFLSENVIPSDALPQVLNLEKIHVKKCLSLVEIIQASSETNESQSAVKFPKLREVSLEVLPKLKYIWKSVFEFPSLTRVCIDECNLLDHVFTWSMVGGLFQLQELHISDCKNMEAIVKVKDSETRMKEVIVFPCLKSLKLEKLQSLKGFCLGKDDFIWPSLDTLVIQECPRITIFTNGRSTTPELKVIDTSFGQCYAKDDLNSFLNTKKQQGFQF